MKPSIPTAADRMPADQLDKLRRLADLPRAWATERECTSIGLDTAELSALAAAGWLECWHHRIDTFFVLTPYAASALAVHLGEHWERQDDGTYLETPEWFPADKEAPQLGPWPYPKEISYPNNILEYVARPKTGRLKGPSERLIDPVSGEPLTLFGGVPVYRERRKPIAKPKSSKNKCKACA